MKKLSENSKQILAEAEKIASKSGNLIESIHILVGITKVKTSYAAEILNRYGFTENIAETYILRTSFEFDNSRIIIGPIVNKILEYAESVATDTNQIVQSYHLLLGIIYHKTCTASKILLKYNITFENILDIVNGISKKILKKEDEKLNKEIDKTNIQFYQDNFKELEKYGIDLTKKACDNLLGKVIGRDNEVNRIIQVLSRKRKNNPIVIGESGVGKTAVIESLAQRIAKNEVPDFLKGYILYSININSIVAGTKYRGEMEEKLEKIISLAEQKKIILFIDEIHSIISAGNSENGGSVSTILKPAITNENLMIIGTTTFSEYSKFFENDPAFERRFMKIIIKEPTPEATKQILLGIKTEFETHYNLSITNAAIDSAIRLSIRYVSNRFLPDKAIDLLDEACSKQALLRSKIVDTVQIKESLAEMTMIPITDDAEENLKILNLEKELNKRIIGQNEAISVLSKTLMRSKSGLREGKKPIGSFIFLGTSGTGKTETAKCLAKILFGTEDALIRFDMSEYMEKSSVARLIGAAPGYIGYEEGGELTEAIKKQPYAVILFDEIEKAHNEVFNILLQVLDDGRLTDSKGRTTDFRNTIIIMTSNAGTEKIGNKKSMGFGTNNNILDEKDIQIKTLQSIFRPEFLNRIDNVIVYNNLNKENLRKIADNIIEEKKKILFLEKGIKLNLSGESIDFIVEKSFEPEYGARPIRRKIEQLLENKLSELILSQNLKENEINITLKEEELSIEVTKKEDLL